MAYNFGLSCPPKQAYSQPQFHSTFTYLSRPYGTPVFTYDPTISTSCLETEQVITVREFTTVVSVLKPASCAASADFMDKHQCGNDKKNLGKARKKKKNVRFEPAAKKSKIPAMDYALHAQPPELNLNSKLPHSSDCNDVKMDDWFEGMSPYFNKPELRELRAALL